MCGPGAAAPCTAESVRLRVLTSCWPGLRRHYAACSHMYMWWSLCGRHNNHDPPTMIQLDHPEATTARRKGGGTHQDPPQRAPHLTTTRTPPQRRLITARRKGAHHTRTNSRTLPQRRLAAATLREMRPVDVGAVARRGLSSSGGSCTGCRRKFLKGSAPAILLTASSRCLVAVPRNGPS